MRPSAPPPPTPAQSAAPGRIARRQITVSLLLLAATVAGCRAPAKPSAPAAKLDATTDPCAMRLHEVTGALLLYFSTHRDLPPTLQELSKSPGAAGVGELTCPISHKPYVYVPAGLPAPDGKSLLVLFDPQPSHAGMRWAVTIQPPDQGPLIAKVIAVPESRFPRLPTTRP